MLKLEGDKQSVNGNWDSKWTDCNFVAELAISDELDWMEGTKKWEENKRKEKGEDRQI